MGRESAEEKKEVLDPLSNEGANTPPTPQTEQNAINTPITEANNTQNLRVIGENGVIMRYNDAKGEVINGVFYHTNLKTDKVDEIGEKGVKQRISHYTGKVSLHKESLSNLKNLGDENATATEEEINKASEVLSNNEGWLQYWTQALNEITAQKKIMEITDETVHNLSIAA